ncbi:MAG: hypothetical protein KatS3mg110_1150 [Pirellulaceae bacterium]|nr:MAG: hypothetical protein KatS3mg110_1150 [Pirellulaceae bacterium]
MGNLVRVRRLANPGWVLLVLLAAKISLGQAYGEPDRGEPGDEMIQKYLREETARIESSFEPLPASPAEWQAKRDAWLAEYYYMLGLSPLPERTELHVTITGTYRGDGFEVDMLHFQSRPRLYVTGNLYRPSHIEPGQRLPAVLYVCGHSNRGRDGNKTAYQSHGIWFAKHGYLCLMLDTLQLGEIAAYHHGTYNLGRFWWHSRGYTPAGVEAWNGMRAIDYLTSRPDVDPKRIAVTGISGGGAATFWIAAADPRIAVAVPVSGMSDLESYVSNRVINGHCDCMFLYNTFRWPWARIAALVAPRPLLFVNSDQDRIFPMDGNERLIARLERVYSIFGAGDRVDAVVSIGGHAYRKDIRQAAFRFINLWLKGDPREVADSELDLVGDSRDPSTYPIPPQRLRVFPTDADLPSDQLNTKIDELFVPIAAPELPTTQQYDEWAEQIEDELRRVVFGYFPDEIPAARLVAKHETRLRLASEPNIEFEVWWPAEQPEAPNSLLLVVLNADEAGQRPPWVDAVRQSGQAVAFCEPRGIGNTRWTRKNPPNYVERSCALVGRTVDTGRVWDVASAVKLLASEDRPIFATGGQQPDPSWKVHVAGRGAAALLAAYAALWSDEVASVTLVEPPYTHMDPAAPQLLNILRVADVPVVLGLLAPTPLTFRGVKQEEFHPTRRLYESAGFADRLSWSN